MPLILASKSVEDPVTGSVHHSVAGYLEPGESPPAPPAPRPGMRRARLSVTTGPPEVTARSHDTPSYRVVFMMSATDEPTPTTPADDDAAPDHVVG